MKKAKDYYGVWNVEFTLQFGSGVWTRRTVSAWTVEEAIKKAEAIERKETTGCMQITKVERVSILDA